MKTPEKCKEQKLNKSVDNVDNVDKIINFSCRFFKNKVK